MYECHGCGGRHETLNSIPATPLKVRTIEKLYRESDSITYSFPAVLHYDKEVGDEMVCDMIVLMTESTVAIYSLAVPEEKWFASYKEDIGETQYKGVEYGRAMCQMASQCYEAGYNCVQSWFDDGEPGGNPPHPLNK